MNAIQEYWNQIQSGEVIVSKRVHRQYERLINDLENPGKYVFDESKANRPITFIERFCKHSKGELGGQPVQLELFQKAYISALFGFVDAETGLRRYRESMFYVARKNGKTTMLSAIALYMMIADGEQGSECFSLASKYDQAKLLFDESWNMIRQSPELSRHIRKRKSDLYFDKTFSKMEPLSKNSKSLDGKNAHLAVIDELHSIQDRNTYEVMQQSQSARQQPLLIMITTAGTQATASIFADMYDYACNVTDGNFEDDSFLPILYELDDKKEYRSNAGNVWQKSNPGLGTIKKVDDLERKVAKAKNSPSDLNGVLTKDFNVISTTNNAWLTFDAINNEETFSLEDFRGWYAIGGADLSITNDTTAASLLFMNPETQKRYVHVMYWLPKDQFHERVEAEKIPYDKWVEQGLMRLCEGNTINYSDITAWFLEMVNDYDITPIWIYYDSYSAKFWVNEMQEYGFQMERCIQGARTLSLPLQHMAADMEAKKINYGNHPILKWNLTNLGVETDRNGNIAPIKAQTAKMKIDGASAMLNSYVGLLDHFEEFKRAM